MNFAEILKNNINNSTTTENGARAKRTTSNPLVDLFFFGGAYRSKTKEEQIKLFSDAFDQYPSKALKCLFYLRDIKEGQGEREFFKNCYRWLLQEYPLIAEKFLYIIAADGYGRYDDIFDIVYKTPYQNGVWKKFLKQLLAEYNKVILFSDYTQVSLLAKWMPSINASSKETRKKAKEFCKFNKISYSYYRKMLTVLRERIDIVERKICQNRMGEIDFNKLPSCALNKYISLFLRNEETSENIKYFLNNKNSKINIKALYPYDVVHNIIKKMDEYQHKITYYLFNENKFIDEMAKMKEFQAYDKMWEILLKNNTLNISKDFICVVDTSGSMLGQPLETALSLSIYCSHFLKGVFHNKMITFSKNPQFIEYNNSLTFSQNIANITKKTINENTNLEKVFDLLLYSAIENNIYEIPDIIVLSDMEIDQATNTPHTTTIEYEMEFIRRKFDKYNIKMPCLIYWNLDARNNTVIDSGKNISYVSGRSPHILKHILSGKNNLDLCLEVLNQPRYKQFTV